MAGPLWFPGLAKALVEKLWSRRPFELQPSTYSSARWLAQTIHAPRCASAVIETPTGSLIIESPTPDLAARCGRLGLTLYPDRVDEAMTRLIKEALGLFGIVSDLLTTIEILVRSLHPLSSRGPGFDTSHSDPELPFSIFVSIPMGEEHAALRLAESILHEAMHLQLTLIEQQWPLVIGSAVRGYSPWQRRERPLTGLLHGLYVFRVIDEFLARLLSSGSFDDATSEFARKRRLEIERDMAKLPDIAGSSALSNAGATLTRLLGASPPSQDNRASWR